MQDNKNIPLVTIYLVNYNYSSFLANSIDSVINQTYQNLEFIIIDDGSTDNSKEIILEYKKKYPNIINIFQENKGLNITNNIALKKAKGKYIMRLDADDWLDEHAIELLVNMLERNKDAGLIFPDYYEVDTEGNFLQLIRRHDFEKVSLLNQPAHGAGTMIKTSCLREIGGYDEEFRRQDGYDLWIRFIKKFNVKNINLPLFYYRQHTKSLTASQDKIYNTRSNILKKRANFDNLNKKKTIAIIPTRGFISKFENDVLRKLGEKPLINWTIDAAIKSKRIDDIIVTSPDENVISHVKSNYGNKIITFKREKQLALPNTFIDQTVAKTLSEYKKIKGFKPDYITLLYIENPFKKPIMIDSTLDILEVFNTDTVIAVTPDDGTLYKHDGNGLNLFQEKKNLSLESNEIYRKSGGIQTLKVNYFEKNMKCTGGTIGHIIIDEKTAFSITSEWKWQIAEILSFKNIETNINIQT